MIPFAMIKQSLRLLALCLGFAGSALAQDAARPRLAALPLQAGMHNTRAELARTPMQTQTGMMFRQEMGANEAMLFVFDQPERRCFWMKNTLLPLSIAFIADDGSIVNLAAMQPKSEESHCSTQPVRFALEMNQGWFAKRGIKPGFKLKGAPFGN